MAGIQPAHASKLEVQLGALDSATKPDDLLPFHWNLHPLKGDLAGHWAIWVNGNWRLTFRFDGAEAEVVDYLDYH